jgi:hypothetical protein
MFHVLEVKNIVIVWLLLKLENYLLGAQVIKENLVIMKSGIIPMQQINPFQGKLN